MTTAQGSAGSPGAGARPVPLSITVLDAATIFEGPETVYRYDLPAMGVVEGWALAGVMDQAAACCGLAWPEVEVTVTADDSGTEVSQEAVAIISRQCESSGAHLLVKRGALPSYDAAPRAYSRGDERFYDGDGYEDDGFGEELPGEDLGDSAQDFTDSVAGRLTSAGGAHRADQRQRAARAAQSPGHGGPRRGRGRSASGRYRAGSSAVPGPRWEWPRWQWLREAMGRIDVFHLSVGAIVLAMAGLSWWAVGQRGESESAASIAGPGAASSAPSAATVGDGRVRVAPTAGAAPPPAGDPGPGQKRIDVEGLSVVLPAGFQTSVDQGLVTATGEDPQLRILLAADPLFNLPPEALFSELRAQIDKDAALREPEEESGRLSYVEDPGDGSRVQWLTWTESGHQLSVGCHTKQEPTIIQKAACRMAAESLLKR